MIIQYENTMSFVNITPVRVKITDSEDSDRLYVRLFNDDLTQSATLYYIMGNQASESTTGNLFITGESYINWGGDSVYVFNYVLNQLSLTYQDPAM